MAENFVQITTSENYQLDRPEIIDKTKYKSDFVAYRPTSMVAVNGTSPFNIVIPREDVYSDPRDSYIELEVEIVKNTPPVPPATDRYANGDNIQPNNLFGISLFREMSLKSFGSKVLETIDNVYIASLMYKLLSDNEEDMMIIYRKDSGDGTEIDETKRDRLINDTPEKGTVFTRIYLKDVLGYIAHLDKVNYGLGYTLTMKRADIGQSIYNTIAGDAAASDAKIEIKDIAWYVRHDTPSFDNISLVNGHILAKKNTEYSYVARTVSSKQVNSNNKWRMEIGSLSGIDIPIYVIVGFQSQARTGPNQRQNNAIFDRVDVIEASCNIGSVRYPEHEYQVDFDRNMYNEPYNEIRRFYKDYIKGEGSPNISFKEFKELYNLWVFDLRNQKDNPSSQPISVDFKFRAGYDAVGADYQATALILSQKIISVSSDGQRQFDII